MFGPWRRAAFVMACVAAACIAAIVCVAAQHGGYQRQEHLPAQSRRLEATPGISESLCERRCIGCSFTFQGPVFDVKNDFVLIHTHGKTASTTLLKSLEQSVLNHGKVTRVDANQGPQSAMELLKRGEITLQFAKSHTGVGAKVFLSRVPTGRRVWVFTSCRNPFKYLPSIFWDDFLHKSYKWQAHLDVTSNASVDVVLDHFSQELAHHVPRDWFGDGDFEKVVGVNLAECGVKFSEGMLYIDRVAHGVRQSIILLRVEDIKRWPAILGKYMPGFRLTAAKHTRDQKPHHSLADAVDARWVWPEEDVRGILRWDTWEFYTVQEKMAMLRDVKMNSSTA